MLGAARGFSILRKVLATAPLAGKSAWPLHFPHGQVGAADRLRPLHEYVGQKPARGLTLGSFSGTLYSKMCLLCCAVRVVTRIAVCLMVCQLITSAQGVIRDGGIDPANLGKGEWIYQMHHAIAQCNGNVPSVTNVPSLMIYLKNQGVRYIIVKAGTGADLFGVPGFNPQFTSSLVDQAHAAGLWIFGYNRSYATNTVGESGDCGLGVQPGGGRICLGRGGRVGIQPDRDARPGAGRWRSARRCVPIGRTSSWPIRLSPTSTITARFPTRSLATIVMRCSRRITGLRLEKRPPPS